MRTVLEEGKERVGDEDKSFEGMPMPLGPVVTKLERGHLQGRERRSLTRRAALGSDSPANHISGSGSAQSFLALPHLP